MESFCEEETDSICSIKLNQRSSNGFEYPENIAQHQSSCPPPPPRPSHFLFTTIIITPSSPPLPHPPTTPLSLTINFISQNQNE
ncbi:hypothetical protein NC652_034978 [Populus alba x Populus x berolinensis]|nr:hypothetical protein NC652_034978 [Populus alba x Populus x berolinensis]